MSVFVDILQHCQLRVRVNLNVLKRKLRGADLIIPFKKWSEYFLFQYLPSHPYILLFLFFSYSCLSLELLISLIPSSECSYFISCSTLSSRSLCLSAPQVRLPRLFLAPLTPPSSPRTVFPASHLPPRNLNRTILEVALTKGEQLERKLYHERGKYLKHICGKVLAKSICFFRCGNSNMASTVEVGNKRLLRARRLGRGEV